MYLSTFLCSVVAKPSHTALDEFQVLGYRSGQYECAQSPHFRLEITGLQSGGDKWRHSATTTLLAQALRSISFAKIPIRFFISMPDCHSSIQASRPSDREF